MIWLCAAAAAAPLPVAFAGASGPEVEAVGQIHRSVNVGLAGAWRTARGPREVAARAAWTTPLFLLERPTNHRLELGLDTGLAGWGPWTLVGRASAGIHLADTQAHRAVSLPLGLGLDFGPHGEALFGALRLDVTSNPATHIRHSDAYRQVLPDAVDGWYAAMGGWWRLDLAGGWRPAPAVALLAAAGLELTARGRPPEPPYDFAVPWIADLRIRWCP